MVKKRKGPSKSATLFSVGIKKKGNDGNIWIIVKNKNGVKRWKKHIFKKNVTKKTKKNFLKKSSQKNRKTQNKKQKTKKNQKYCIHDNGGRPFKVVINGKNLDIFTYDKDLKEELGEDNVDYNKLIKSYKNLKNIFIPKGFDDRGDAWSSGKGNTILAHISGNRYLLIGSSIYEFETKKEKILEFHSQVGNSDVPYPLAVGENNVYFLMDNGSDGYISKDYFEGFPKKHSWMKDGYLRLWGQKEKFNDLTKKTKKIPKIKIICKRLW